MRTAHRTNSDKKEKKVERLFASSNARADEREPLQEEEEEFLVVVSWQCVCLDLSRARTVHDDVVAASR
ncbi:hypothetical protein ANCCAN_26255 [Ancylostoma caninum]|uniref:Uncharacterized protein n=1 Tax=Ancylostoma caninum TaxID=29170 RepID=A0A368F8W7_ANCCA|nr:hypothetical protein ANCCAN_26255 [Ancylostoma caninum]